MKSESIIFVGNILLILFVCLIQFESATGEVIGIDLEADPKCEADAGGNRCGYGGVVTNRLFTPKCEPVSALLATTSNTGWGVIEENSGDDWETFLRNRRLLVAQPLTYMQYVGTSFWDLDSLGVIEFITLPNDAYNCHSFSFYCRDIDINMVSTYEDPDPDVGSEEKYWEDGSASSKLICPVDFIL